MVAGTQRWEWEWKRSIQALRAGVFYRMWGAGSMGEGGSWVSGLDKWLILKPFT